MADREIISQKSSAMPTSSFDANVASRSIPNSDGISKSVWQERLNLLKKPRVLISLFLASSALYCFVIGRDRYISVSEFVIQQAVPLNTSSASVLAGAAAAPQVLTSFVDGQYLHKSHCWSHWAHSQCSNQMSM